MTVSAPAAFAFWMKREKAERPKSVSAHIYYDNVWQEKISPVVSLTSAELRCRARKAETTLAVSLCASFSDTYGGKSRL